MADLFPLELRAVGTTDVESLGSYMHRLSQLHGVSVSELMRYTYASYAHRCPEFRQTVPVLRSYGYLASYIRPNQTTQDIVDSLTHLTGQKQLHSATLLALNKALARSIGFFVPHMRWCPACINEFIKEGDSGYYKLVWQIAEFSYCPIHHVKLVNKCPHCDSYQDSFGYKKDVIFCQKCGQVLQSTIRKDQLTSSWVSEASDILELVDLITTNPNFFFPADGFRKIIKHLVKHAWKTHQNHDYWKQLPIRECLKRISGDYPVTLANLRRISARYRLSLVDILNGRTEMLPLSLDDDWFNELPIQLRPKKRDMKEKKETVFIRMSHIIEDSDHPLPLQQLAERLNVSTGYLHYNFPALSKKIIRTYQDWQKRRRTKLRKEIHSEALKFFKNREGIVTGRSRKKAFRTLRAEKGYPKNILREEINSVYKFLTCVNTDLEL